MTTKQEGVELPANVLLFRDTQRNPGGGQADLIPLFMKEL